jgi:hypothetical protein
MPNDVQRSRKRRVAAAVAATIAAVVAFASVGGVGLAQGLVSAAQYQYGKKVTICHKGKTLTISAKAWPAHQRHGDTSGKCANSAKKKNKGKHKGESHHAPNPATDSGASSDDASSQQNHGHGKNH